jgi:tRNA1(Val) A37 N6-methylase TrmN6
VGSVLLMVTWAGRPSIAVGVEAQSASVELALRTIADLAGVDGTNLSVLHGDFRESIPAEFAGQFDLVTGSPPYFPVGTGVASPDPQRFACRFETRGGIEEYLSTAARLLAPEGRVCVVFQWAWQERVMEAARRAGLHLHERTDAVMRDDGDVFLASWVFGLAPGDGLVTRRLRIRDAESKVTAEWEAVRVAMGLAGPDDPPR